MTRASFQRQLTMSLYVGPRGTCKKSSRKRVSLGRLSRVRIPARRATWSALADKSPGIGFDTFCPVSDFLPADSVPDPHNLRLWLKINDKVKQAGSTSDMMCVSPLP